MVVMVWGRRGGGVPEGPDGRGEGGPDVPCRFRERATSPCQI